MDVAQAIHDSGLQAAGYEFVNSECVRNHHVQCALQLEGGLHLALRSKSGLTAHTALICTLARALQRLLDAPQPHCRWRHAAEPRHLPTGL